jgi:hypothetical protein
MTTKFGTLTAEGTTTQTVTAKDDKEVTIKVVIKANGMEQSTDQKIDLTKPYDPTKTGLPPGADVKVEKVKDGTEKVKAAGKDYECKWETYKVTGKAMGIEISADVKVWQSKDLPLQVIKMESTAELAGMKVETTMELSEAGHKSD